MAGAPVATLSLGNPLLHEFLYISFCYMSFMHFGFFPVLSIVLIVLQDILNFADRVHNRV